MSTIRTRFREKARAGSSGIRDERGVPNLGEFLARVVEGLGGYERGVS